MGKTIRKTQELVGIFLMGVSIALFLFGLIYLYRANLNYAWIGFGIVYACSVFGILGNKKLKKKLGVERDSRIIKPASIVILAIGLILSFAIAANYGERYLILGVLITVGLHFLPFGARYALALCILAIANGMLGIFLPVLPVWIFVFIDGAIKLFIGVWMYLKNRN